MKFFTHIIKYFTVLYPKPKTAYYHYRATIYTKAGVVYGVVDGIIILDMPFDMDSWNCVRDKIVDRINGGCNDKSICIDVLNKVS